MASAPLTSLVDEQRHIITSTFLKRDVIIDILLPAPLRPTHPYPLLLLNDGQDLPSLHLKSTLQSLYHQQIIESFILVAIHTCSERIQEYGTCDIPDYKGRGSKADLYRQFVMEELLPFVRQHFVIDERPDKIAFAGCSLGALSAFDMVWQYGNFFGMAGAFSGSFWWRSKEATESEPDAHRIMHQKVQESNYSNQRFWFQAGTKDETSDRNQNGIIDVIDDIQDLIKEIKEQQCPDSNIRYLEVAGGTHCTKTWSKAFPDFLLWAFESKKNYELNIRSLAD